MDAVKKGTINPKNYITHTLPFNIVKDEFKNLLKPENNVIKAMIEME